MSQILNSLDPTIRSPHLKFFKLILSITCFLHFFIWILNYPEIQINANSDYRLLVFLLLGSFISPLIILDMRLPLNFIATYTALWLTLDLNPYLGYGGTQILLIILILMCFVPNSKNQITCPWRGWAIRCIQLQFVMVYFFAAVVKMYSQEWITGNAVFQIMHSSLAIEPIASLFRIKIIAVWLNYLTLLVELICPITIWFKSTKALTLAMLITMHLFMAISLGTFLFPLVMFCGIYSFLITEDCM